MAESMDPSNLSPDELAEEFQIRQIIATGQEGLRLLSQAITDEGSRKAFPPKGQVSLRVLSEARQCKDLIKMLTEELQNLSRTGDENSMRALRSKFLHLRGKVRRLADISGSDESTVSLVGQVNQMDTLFAAISDYISPSGSGSPEDNLNGQGAVGVTTTSASNIVPDLNNQIFSSVPIGNSNVWGGIGQNSDVFQDRSNVSLNFVAPPNADSGIISALMSTVAGRQ